MPNHITNRLNVEGKKEDIDKLFDFIKSDVNDEDGKFVLIDFNKIIPMPDSLDIPSSTEGEDGQKYLLGHSGNLFQIGAYKKSEHYKKMEALRTQNPKDFDRCIELGKQFLHNIANYGHTDWYSWRIANWGTKWNAYEIVKDGDNTIFFQTAWNGVPKLIRKLASMFPDVTIKYDFADEDAGYNVGSFIMKGYEVENNSPADDSAEAWSLVFDLDVASREDYIEQPDGSFRYKED